MKIILTAPTGQIGSEILSQCLSHPSITSIIALSRRPLASNEQLPKNNKGASKATYEENRTDVRLKVLIVDDIGMLGEGVLRECEGAQGCIWAIGGAVSDFEFLKEARKVNVDYPVAAAEAFIRKLVPALQNSDGNRDGDAQRKFRFCYVSAHGAERNEEKAKSLWLFKDTRSLKGEAESKLMEVSQKEEAFEVCCARPGGVIPVGSTGTKVLGGMMEKFGVVPSVGIEELAAAMINWIVKGRDNQESSGEGILVNGELKRRGREILSEQE